MKHFFFLLCLPTLCLAAEPKNSNTPDALKPNIVLILCDDLGYGDVGFNGAQDIVTPELDKLASNGTICTSGYVPHPFCGPSRMGMLTGRYPHKFGAPFNLPPQAAAFEKYDDAGVPVSETLLGTVLQQAGYRTGAVGKWHMGFAPQYHPNKRGFDDFYGFLGGGHAYFPERFHAAYERQKKAGVTRFHEYITPLEHNGQEVTETEYITDALSREAVRFVKQSGQTDQPFFLYLAYNAPHAPLQAKKEDLAKFSHIKDTKRKTYAAMVYAVDRGVGQLVQALQETNSLDNTLIVFLSDNGGKIGLGANNGPLRQGKGSVCEGGFRVPMFFHWPNHVKAGQRFEDPVTALDFYPTFTRLAGAKVPAQQKLDGQDIWAALTDGTPTTSGKPIFALRHREGSHDVGIRQGQWKALKLGNDGPWQLFDINQDIGEQHDVSQQHSATIQSLVAEAKQWSTSHTNPAWYLSTKEEADWQQQNMPVYSKTFKLNQETKPASSNDTGATNKSADESALQKNADPQKTTETASKPRKKPNVLFIAIDDLRPELGCYGSPIAITPNLDSIADSGLLFERAYCQQAICRPSRASLMTGTRPETTGLFHNYVALRELQPDILTLPQHLIAHGYDTAYVGKIFHNGDTDEANSWNFKPVRFIKDIKKPQGAFRLPENIKLKADNFKQMYAKYGEAAKRGLASGPAFEKADVPDHAYPDGYNTLLAIETMKKMAAADKPFFLGMGYKLPHLNWCSPTKYWDMYNPAEIPLETAATSPENGAAMGLHASFELRVRSNIPKYGPIPPDLARTLKHAYLASTSYVDAQIGLLLETLKDLNLDDNTIIVVWGDHGWHLGDMGVWGKATNYEIATRVPLMIRTPKMRVRGAKTKALVELVDIFPTLCELADVPKPKHLEGHSFVPLIDHPNLPWKKAAFSQYPNPALREWAANPLSRGMRETWFGPLIQDVEQKIIDQQGPKWNRELFEQHLMGYSMRTDRYRFVAWRDHRNPDAKPLFVELFDHQTDPNETNNVADKNPAVVQRLFQQMQAGWQASLNP